MRKGDYVTIKGEQYTVDTLIGRGRMGEVYSLRETIGNQNWVIKVALEGSQEAESALKQEFQRLQVLAKASPTQPSVPRALEGQAQVSPPVYVLAMEHISEHHQLAPWIMRQLNAAQPQQEAVIWQVALDYLNLLDTVHREIGRSITDRKLNDFRILMGDKKPRLVVLDWGLVSETLNVSNDIRILGQIWYTMITMLSASDTSTEAYHPLGRKWGEALTVGGRLLLRGCLTGGFRTIQETAQAIQSWMDVLLSPRIAALRGEISAATGKESQETFFSALRAADLLKRLDPVEGSPLYDSLLERFNVQQERTFSTLRQQAATRVTTARQEIDGVLGKWRMEWRDLVPLLKLWSQTLDDLEQIESERYVWGAQTAVVRALLATLRDKLTRAYRNLELPNQDSSISLRQSLLELQGILDRAAAGSDSPNSLKILRSTTNEVQALLYFWDAEFHLEKAMIQEAQEALVAALQSCKSIQLNDPKRYEVVEGVLVRPIQKRHSDLEQIFNLETISHPLSQQIAAAIQQRDFAAAISTYQTGMIAPALPYQRLLWSEQIEPALLIQALRCREVQSPETWLKVLDQTQEYLYRASASPIIAEAIFEALDTPYEVFLTHKQYNRPSSDALALVMGTLMLSIYNRCQKVINP